MGPKLVNAHRDSVESEIAMLRSRVAFCSIKARYDEPWRAHHAWHHPTAMYQELLAAETDGVEIDDAFIIASFIAYHDIVYCPGALHGMNERLSAQLCRQQLDWVSYDRLERIVMTIHSTITHQHDPRTGNDGALSLDIDLGILGSPPERYDRFDDDIRTEYAHVEHDVYWKRRREILGGFLMRPRIYLTEWAHARWDERARENLTRSMDRAARELGGMKKGAGQAGPSSVAC